MALIISRVGQVRAPAEVGECAVGIERDRAVLEVRDQFHLVLVALLGEGLQRVGLAILRVRMSGLLVAGKLHHLLFDGFGRSASVMGVGRVHVVVEAVLDGRADAELDARIERFERLGQQVRRGVPESVLAFGVVPFVEFDRSVLFDRARFRSTVAPFTEAASESAAKRGLMLSAI